MKTSRVLLSLFAAVGLSVLAHGQSGAAASGQKTPADVAAEEFFKLRDIRNAKLDEARFDQLIKAGTSFLENFASDERAPAVVTDLATFSLALSDPKLSMYRIAYAGRLNSTIIDLRYKELSPAAKAACTALDAAALDNETRAKFDRENLKNLREKIDALARLPGAGRFLAERERSYADILARGSGPAAGEKHLRRLLDHQDKAVATMAQDELNLIEVRKAPYEMKFTALDGRAFDVTALRGKVVAVFFWSAADEAAMKAFATVKKVHASHAANGFEVVGVSYDKEEDREKLGKLLKDNKLAWPVHFDGKGTENAFGTKLNVHRVPTVAFFNQKGMLLTHNLPPDRLEGEVVKLLGIKEQAPPEMEERSSGSRKKR